MCVCTKKREFTFLVSLKQALKDVFLQILNFWTLHVYVDVATNIYFAH